MEQKSYLAVATGILSLLLVISEYLAYSKCDANSISQLLYCSCFKTPRE